MDRHTVNTEVQLSNLEYREISRFETVAGIVDLMVEAPHRDDLERGEPSYVSQ